MVCLKRFPATISCLYAPQVMQSHIIGLQSTLDRILLAVQGQPAPPAFVAPAYGVPQAPVQGALRYTLYPANCSHIHS